MERHLGASRVDQGFPRNSEPQTEICSSPTKLQYMLELCASHVCLNRIHLFETPTRPGAAVERSWSVCSSLTGQPHFEQICIFRTTFNSAASLYVSLSMILTVSGDQSGEMLLDNISSQEIHEMVFGIDGLGIQSTKSSKLMDLFYSRVSKPTH